MNVIFPFVYKIDILFDIIIDFKRLEEYNPPKMCLKMTIRPGLIFWDFTVLFYF